MGGPIVHGEGAGFVLFPAARPSASPHFMADLCIGYSGTLFQMVQRKQGDAPSLFLEMSKVFIFFWDRSESGPFIYPH